MRVETRGDTEEDEAEAEAEAGDASTFRVKLPDGTTSVVSSTQPKRAALKGLSRYLHDGAATLRKTLDERWAKRWGRSAHLPSFAEALRLLRTSPFGDMAPKLGEARSNDRFSGVSEERFVTFTLKMALLREEDFDQHRIEVTVPSGKVKRYKGGYEMISALSPWKIERCILYDCKLKLDKTRA